MTPLRTVFLYLAAVLLGMVAGTALHVTDYGRNTIWSSPTEEQRNVFKNSVLDYMEEHGRFDMPVISQSWDKIYSSGDYLCEQLSTRTKDHVIEEGILGAQLTQHPISESEARFIMVMMIHAATQPGSLCP